MIGQTMSTACILVLVLSFLNVSVDAQVFNCINKNDGNYPDPADACSGFFYMCSNGNPYYFACALKGTVFSAALDRCEYCDLVSPCNSNPNALRCPLGGPTCPSFIPDGYVCVCSATSCELVLRPPTCPPYDPNVYTCTCGVSSCQLNLISTTTPPRPQCPPYDPNIYTCTCGVSSCQLNLIPTTTPARPTCPPYDPNVYTCICGATSCILQLVPTTTTARPTCPPFDPNIYTCTCGVSSCQLNLIPTTPARPTCPPFDPNVYTCVCGSTSCSLQLIPTTSRPGGAVTAPCVGRTIRPTQSPVFFDCAGKADGNYEDPIDPCSGGFFMCTNQISKYFDCALQNTVFDKTQDRCDYCSVVTACSASG